MHLWHIPGVAPIRGRPNSHMVRILNVPTPRGNIMSRCQQYIASVHISCQISYHHDYRHPLSKCCGTIGHVLVHDMLSKVPNMAPPYVDDMFAYMVHIGRVSVDYISSKAPDMGSPPYVDDMLTYI